MGKTAPKMKHEETPAPAGASDDAISAAAAALEGDDAISAALAATEGETVTAASTPKAPRAKKAATPKAPKAPRVSLSTHKASEVIRNTLGPRVNEFGALSVADASLDATSLATRMDATLVAVDALDKKTREKACNLFDFVANGGRLSIYTRLTLDALLASGRMTTKQVVDHLAAQGYKPKTARRQASEMVALFPVVDIASKPEKGVLELNGGSTVVAAIQARLAETPIAATA